MWHSKFKYDSIISILNTNIHLNTGRSNLNIVGSNLNIGGSNLNIASSYMKKESSNLKVKSSKMTNANFAVYEATMHPLTHISGENSPPTWPS